MNPGSERLEVVLQKENVNQSWGFRLQGGADFTTPLSVQSVAAGGLAERCGLMAGDAVLSLNSTPSDELEHEAAKQIIVMAGNQVVMIVQRGAVKVWQPKVTPLSQLRPGEVKTPGDLDGPDPYIQRTSLAADKNLEYKPIGTGYNRSARPFQGFGASAPVAAPAAPQAPAFAPAAPAQQAHAFASAPAYAPQSFAAPQAPASQLSSQNNQQYAPAAPPPSDGRVQPQSINDGMTNLHVSSNRSATSPQRMKTTPVVLITSDSEPSAERASASLQVIRELEQGKPTSHKRPVSPLYAALMRTVQDTEDGATSGGSGVAQSNNLDVLPSSPTATRSVSPTLLAVLEEQKKQQHQQSVDNNSVSTSTTSSRVGDVTDASREAENDWHETLSHGNEEESKQSRSFRMLQAEVGDNGDPAAPLPSGIRSVRAPVTKAPSDVKQDSQYMTCKVCGTLCVGVFVRVKGEPMHPECYKCTSCGCSLKNQGFYTIQEKLYCNACAQNVAQQQTGGQVSTVYR